MTLVLQAHLASQNGKTGETPLRTRTSSSALQTPPASPHKGRGSYRILNAQKRNYANLAGAEPRKRKRQIPQRSEKRGDESSSDRIANRTIEVGCQSIDQQACYSSHLDSLFHILDPRLTIP